MSTKVGIAGATGSVGQEVIKVLDAAPWRPDEIVPLARAATTIPFVDYGGAQVAVDDLVHQVWDELDLLIVATPKDVAREAAGGAIDDGVLTVDCSGAFADDDDVPLVVPWINPEKVQAAVEAGAVSVPSGPALLIASILGPLRRAAVDGAAAATVFVPASIYGRHGIEELSKQVVALFNSATPPRKIFENGLAFDLAPQLGVVDEFGRTALESRVAAEVNTLVGMPIHRVTAVGVPVFSGMSAQLSIRATRRVPAELVSQILADGGVIVADDNSARSVPRPRSVEGHPFAHVGRIHVDHDGEIHIWCAIDNLRATAAAAVACGGALIKGVSM